MRINMEAHPEIESLKHRVHELERDNGNYRVQIAEYRQIVAELSEKLRTSVKYPSKTA